MISTTLLTLTAAGKDAPKRQNDAPQDRIDVLAKVRMTDGPVTRFTMTKHYGRSYLYVEHASHKLTLVDVTDGQHPAVVANLDLHAAEAGSVLAAAGDTALMSSEAASAMPQKTATMTIVSFADHDHPQTVRHFANVTCSAVDDRRGLVFIANDEGVWILHRNPADDPEMQERYANEVLYNH